MINDYGSIPVWKKPGVTIPVLMGLVCVQFFIDRLRRNGMTPAYFFSAAELAAMRKTWMHLQFLDDYEVRLLASALKDARKYGCDVTEVQRQMRHAERDVRLSFVEV